MTTLLLDCAIRSALIILATALVLGSLRIRRPAARHAAWTTGPGIRHWALGTRH
jgi:hypothetical protein